MTDNCAAAGAASISTDRPGAGDDALRRSEQRYRSLVDATAQVVWTASATGEVVEDLPSWRKLTGQSADAVRGFGWISAVHPDDLARVQKVWQESLRSGLPHENEFRIRAADGNYRHVLARAVPVMNDDGSVREWIGTLTDISKQQRWQDELRRAKEQAEAANRAKDQFIAVLSHELRTPLTPVLATVSALEQQRGLPDSVREDLEIVRRNVELETRLIDDLLDLTRITKGKLQLNIEPVDLCDMVRRVLPICREEVEAKGLRLEVKLPPERLWARGDSARLQQVLWNLVKNAVKFTPDGGCVTVRASATPDARHLTVEVADTGIGIVPEAMTRLFDAFEQCDASGAGPHRFGGLGLGLTISKYLAEAHGGTLAAQSEGADRGSIFTLTLPLAAAPTPASAPAASRDPAGAGPPPAGPARRILLVEDHPDTARIMVKLLRASNYHVEWAANIASALTAARAHSFDLVVSDLGLPDGSGLELMRELRDRFALKGIALSGYGMEEDVLKSQEAGFAEHLIKPVSFTALKQTIENVASK